MESNRLRNWVVGYFVVGAIITAVLVTWLGPARHSQRSPDPATAAPAARAFLRLVAEGQLSEARAQLASGWSPSLAKSELPKLKRDIAGKKVGAFAPDAVVGLVAAALAGVGAHVPSDVRPFSFRAGGNYATVWLVPEGGAWRVYTFGYGEDVFGP